MDSTDSTSAPAFRRVLLKLSGESFCRPGEGGISVEEVSRIARQVSRVAARGVQLAIVVGGGNILRGAQLSRGSDVIKEATAHYMGMTATVINGLALQDALESVGCPTRLLTTIRMDEVAEPFIRRRALSHLERGRIVEVGPPQDLLQNPGAYARLHRAQLELALGTELAADAVL